MNPEVFGSFNSMEMWGDSQYIKHEGTVWYLSNYRVDHDLDQKFREDDGVRVYENGRVVIEIRPRDRNEDRMVRMRTKFGINFERVQETVGYKFFLPDGTPVNKNRIDNGFYLFDDIHRKMFKYEYAGSSNENQVHEITYYGPHALPTGVAPFDVTLTNKADVEWLIRELQPVLKLGLTCLNLNNDKELIPDASNYIQSCRTHKKVWMPDAGVGAERGLLITMGLILRGGPRYVRRRIEMECQDVHQFTFLNYERK